MAGVDLGGLTKAEARTKIEQQVAAPLEKPVTVTSGKQRFTLSAKDAGLNADVDAMVDEAVDASREGSIFTRSWRDLTGGEENTAIAPRVTYSKAAANKLVARVAEKVDQPAKDAKLEFPSLAKVDSQDGRAGERREAARHRGHGDDRPRPPRGGGAGRAHQAQGHARPAGQEVPDAAGGGPGRVPAQALQGPEAEEELQHRRRPGGPRDPRGPVRDPEQGRERRLDGAQQRRGRATMAGQVIPGGSPENPLKARWMGIFAGAGIHGTDQTGSLGSAASHGCVRMAIPDVIELYDQVPVKTPIYIG